MPRTETLGQPTINETPYLIPTRFYAIAFYILLIALTSQPRRWINKGLKNNKIKMADQAPPPAGQPATVFKCHSSLAHLTDRISRYRYNLNVI